MANDRKKPKKPVRRSPAAKKKVPTLTPDARARLLKPPGNAEELVERAAEALAALRRRVPTKVRPNELLRLVKNAKKARAREQKLIDAFEERITPLSDARLIAYDAMWRRLLDLYAAVKFAGREDPLVLDRFSFLTGALSRRKGASTETAPANAEPAPQSDSSDVG